MIKVCVLGHTFIGWGGGIDLIKKYINAMLDRNDLQVMLLLPEVANTSDLIFDFSSAYPNLPIKVLSPNDSIVDVLKNEKVNIIFPSHPALGHDFPIPWIGYICDFQHKYYPEFFSSEEIAQREALFPHVLNESRAIIVTSRTAKEDIEKYYPELSFKSAIYVEPFFPTPRKTWFELDNVNIVKYNLPERYFIISNQFWIHKAHNTAFEALALLHEDSRYKDVKLVCTGKMDDYRDDSHSAKLKKLLEKLNIVEQVMFLGYIPKLEQIKILRNSVSLVQPTLYEGSPGGAAVEDAIAMGKRAIVSDIPVNKEINCGEILFFKAGSAENLKEKMIIALETLENSPSNEFLINRMNDSKIIMGNFITDMCQQVIASYENGSKNFSGVSDENLKEIDEYIGNLQTRLNNMQSKINALEIKEKSTPPPRE